MAIKRTVLRGKTGRKLIVTQENRSAPRRSIARGSGGRRLHATATRQRTEHGEFGSAQARPVRKISNEQARRARRGRASPAGDKGADASLDLNTRVAGRPAFRRR